MRAWPRGFAEERDRARRTFWRAMSGSVVVIRGAVTTHQPPLALARRVVPPLVDTLMKREYSILGFAALMNHDAYTHAHCVNVSLLSIAIGRLLGLARTDLANLGVAALLHDVGKLNVPAEILCKAGKLSP